MQIIENFERWWRETGQFIEPCGSNPVFIEHCHEFAKNLTAVLEADVKAETDELEQRIADAEEEKDKLWDEYMDEKESLEEKIEHANDKYVSASDELEQANEEIHALKQRIAELENANRNQ